jgi:LAS superfamily LD-carboxypeptidase LdcB
MVYDERGAKAHRMAVFSAGMWYHISLIQKRGFNMNRKTYIAIGLVLIITLMAGCNGTSLAEDEPFVPEDAEVLAFKGNVTIEDISITQDGLLIDTNHDEYAGDLLPLSVIECFLHSVKSKTSGADMITFTMNETSHVDMVSGTDVYFLDGEEKIADGPSFETSDEEYVHVSVLVEILGAIKTEEGWLVPVAGFGVGSGEMVSLADYRGKLGFMSLINKEHGLDREATGHDLINLNEIYPQFSYLKSDMEFNQTAALALNRMVSDLMNEPGMEQLYLVSTYRGYDYQDSIYKRKIKQYMDNYGYDEETATVEAGRIVAIPGTSEHQSGLAVDFTGKTLVDQGLYLEQAFLETPSGAWLHEHASDYGFALRYPEGTEDLTEIMQEAWHYRYVGLPHSEIIADNQLVLETYVQMLKEQGKQGLWIEGSALILYLDEEWTDMVRVDDGLADVSDSNEGGMIVTIHGW